MADKEHYNIPVIIDLIVFHFAIYSLDDNIAYLVERINDLSQQCVKELIKQGFQM